MMLSQGERARMYASPAADIDGDRVPHCVTGKRGRGGPQ
jgi:hypothetical protein